MYPLAVFKLIPSNRLAIFMGISVILLVSLKLKLFELFQFQFKFKISSKGASKTSTIFISLSTDSLVSILSILVYLDARSTNFSHPKNTVISPWFEVEKLYETLLTPDWELSVADLKSFE